jgi:CheY-like chemotaxis protein
MSDREDDRSDRVELLLVDDEAGYVKVVAKRMAKRNIEVTPALSGAEALTVLEEDPPEVIVLDVMLPGTRGTELLKLIKQEHPRIPGLSVLVGAACSRDRPCRGYKPLPRIRIVLEAVIGQAPRIWCQISASNPLFTPTGQTGL